MAVSDVAAIGDEAPTTRPGAGRWRARARIGALAGLYIFVWGLIGLYPLDPNDLDAFFLPSVRVALAGHPLHIYAVRYEAIYPNANGPLSMLPLTLLGVVLRAVGWLDTPDLRRMLIMAAFAVFGLLLAWEGVAAIDRLRGAPLRGIWRGLAYVLFACAPTLLHGMLFYGHMELALMLWLCLFGVRALTENRPGRAGVALGLAILTRSNALVYLLALLVVLACRRRWRVAWWLGGAAGATVALGVLPFFVADPADTAFSLVTFHGALPVGGGSFWLAFVGTRVEPLAQHADTLFVLAAAVIISLVVALARRDLTVEHRDLYGLLVLAGLAFPLFIKTVWPYYFLDMYVFIAIWWLGGRFSVRAGAWRWLGLLLPAFFVGCALLAEYATGLLTNPPALVRESLVEALLVAGFLLLFGAWLIRTGDGAMYGTAQSGARVASALQERHPAVPHG